MLMRQRICVLLAAGLVVVAVGLLGCSEREKTDDAAVSEGSGVTATALAVTDAPLRSDLEAAGFSVTSSHVVPSPVGNRITAAVAYRAKSGKGGGLLIATREETPGVVWHWYFADAAPDSAVAIELNDDGLWDLRVYFGSKTRDFVQLTDFTMLVPVRRDRIALNAGDVPGELWRAFDTDSTTAWLPGSGEASLKIATPMRTSDGIVVVQLGRADGASTCVVEVGGKRLQELNLKPTTLAQTFRLDAGARGVSEVSLTFRGAGGEGVSISELEIR